MANNPLNEVLWKLRWCAEHNEFSVPLTPQDCQLLLAALDKRKPRRNKQPR